MTTTPPRAVVIIGGLLALAVSGFLMYNSFTPPVVRACRARYTAAKTAADTAQVDLAVLPEAQKLAEPRSCGSYRFSGRWQ